MLEDLGVFLASRPEKFTIKQLKYFNYIVNNWI